MVAEHRVEELERLVDSRPDAARDLLAEARDAVADAANPILADRLDAVVDSLRAAGDAAPADVETDRLDQDAVPTTTTDPAHSSGSGAPTDVRDGASATDGGDVSGERDDSDDDPVVADPAESDRPLHDDGTDDRLDPGTDTAEEDAPATTAAPTDADAIDGATGDRTAPNDTP